MLVNLFSKRQRKERGDFPDVYQYEEIPNSLRTQVVHMLREAYIEGGDGITHRGHEVIKGINEILCREYGTLYLVGPHISGFEELITFLLETKNSEKVLDVIEITFRYIDTEIRQDIFSYNQKLNVDSLIGELNQRFKESGVGYQYESGKIIRMDSEFAHAEIIKPTLNFLRKKSYHSVNEEFLSAHEHYRNERYEESITECLKALESLLKTICTERGWTYEAGDTAKKLIEIVLNNELIPSFMENQLNTMQTLLESGVPTVRNKLAAHGQGPSTRIMPGYIASYVIHLTATTLLLLASANATKS